MSKKIKITTKLDCQNLGQKLINYSMTDKFKPFEVAYVDKKRTLPQNKYYWGQVVDVQYQYFKNKPFKFIELLFKHLNNEGITRDFIHEVNKVLYNKGKSTTGLSVDSFFEKFLFSLRDDFMHYCGKEIPLPEDKGLMEYYENLIKERSL